MHVSIVPVLIVGTFVYMYELKISTLAYLLQVFPTDDVIGGIPSPTVISFGTDANTCLFM